MSSSLDHSCWLQVHCIQYAIDAYHTADLFLLAVNIAVILQASGFTNQPPPTLGHPETCRSST